MNNIIENAWKKSFQDLSFNKLITANKHSCSQFLNWFFVTELEALLLIIAEYIRERNLNGTLNL